MKQFVYRAKDSSGQTVSGSVESTSVEQAARTLQDRRLLVISLGEKREFDPKAIFSGWFKQKTPLKEIAIFTRLLSTMMATGLPLTDALSNLITQTSDRNFRSVIQTMLHDIQGGLALSESMSRHPAVFDNFYVSLVKAGEASGKVDSTLEELADSLESNLEFQAKVFGALLYPAVIVSATVLIGLFMLTSVVPKVAEVYKEFGADLPLPTKILIVISSAVRDYTLVVILFLVAAIFTYRTLKKNLTIEFIANNLILKLPVFGRLWEEVTLTIITGTLATLLSSGVSILDSLKIVTNTVANNYFRAGLQNAAKYVEKGLPLSLALKRDENFPPMMSQLLAIGEETGTVDQSLKKLSKFYRDSSERKTKNLTTLLEPLLILVMGGMVAGLALAVLLPMFNLVNVINK